MGQPDPKPPAREKDPDARKKARLAADACAACGRGGIPLNMHHVLYGADGRHDDPNNLLPLCGSGTTGCHGKLHAFDPDTLANVGAAIADRPGIIAFIVERLGEERGKGYLRRRYGIAL